MNKRARLQPDPSHKRGATTKSATTNCGNCVCSVATSDISQVVCVPRGELRDPLGGGNCSDYGQEEIVLVTPEFAVTDPQQHDDRLKETGTDRQQAAGKASL